MKIFQNDRTLNQSIAFASIMAAICVVINLLVTFVPFLFFIVILLLPFTSILVTLTCKKIIIPFFIATAFGVSLLTTLWDFSNSFFYILPALLAGAFLGLIIDKKLPNILMIFLPSLIYLGFTYLSIPIIKAIYNIDIVESFLKIIGLNNNENIYYFVPSFIFLCSLIQSFISFIIIKNESKKLSIEIKACSYEFNFNFIISCFFLLLSIPFIFLFPPLCFLFALFFILFSLYPIYLSLKKKKTLIYVFNVISLLVCVFSFGLLYQYMPKNTGIYLINIFFFMSLFVSFIDISFSKRKINIK